MFSKYKILQKIFTLIFTFVVLCTVFYLRQSNKEILFFAAMILLNTMVYLEMLVIRDHIWIMEGALKETRKWRDAFFSRQSLFQQRLKKIVIVVFSTALFTWLYTRIRDIELYFSLGIILMITVLYIEALTLRDELFILNASIHESPSGSSDTSADQNKQSDELEQKDDD